MTSTQQRAVLQRQIWQIANDVRGSVDGWDFKQYVLGTLFYRFISENFTSYIEGGDESIDYANLPDDVITPEIKDDAIKTKGYFIYPSQLFVNIVNNCDKNSDLNTDLKDIFMSLENSANGYDSEDDIKGLFTDFDTTSNRLGNTVAEKNSRLCSVLKGVNRLKHEDYDDREIDLFGDAYEFLISNYAANAGKSGGEFFTPQSVSKLLSKLAMHSQDTINKIYDPAAGSGSLLLQAKKQFKNHIVEDGFFGQEINHTTYNLARMNMFLHNINYDKFNIALGNTLTNPYFMDDKPFDAIVSNPPYSVKWIGSDDPTLINDDRYAPAGVLAPKSKADFAFVLHCLNYLSPKGKAAIVCFPGIFHRAGTEQKIRKYLIDGNYIESIISLAPNLFFGTPIAVNILVLAKNKKDTKTQFIDASGLFKKEINNNILTDNENLNSLGHIQQILGMFESKEEIEYLTTNVDMQLISEKDYNLSVSSYVKAKDTNKKIDIAKLNLEIQETVLNIDRLRNEINKITLKIGNIDNNTALIEKLLQDEEVIWEKLGDIAEYEQPTKYLVTSTNYNDKFKTPVLTAGKTFILGYTDEIDGIYKASENPVIIFDDFTTANKWVDFDFKAKSSAMKMITSKNASKVSLKYVYYWLNTLPSDLTEGDHKRQWIRNFSNKSIPIPDIDIQIKIVEILDKFMELTDKLSKELKKELDIRNKQYSHYGSSLFPKKDIKV
ncbi:type I restriction-modification system subunit M [uncultured Arcobacter sp.]|uniref:type I restriction-modification system subunit M n=1 Tax=uncultured Arcobacter sp. TaxID=165434 RepID=UPI00262DF81C|nr:type I restriction-modification system subunit M [uncultured Arcobacter sp.]